MYKKNLQFYKFRTSNKKLKQEETKIQQQIKAYGTISFVTQINQNY